MVNKIYEWKNKMFSIKAAAIAMLSLLVLSTIAVPTEAHMPGAKPPPETDFEMGSIVIEDGGKTIEITIDDVGKYHNERMKEVKSNMLKKQNKTDEEIAKIIEEEFGGNPGTCPCTSFAYRAALLGISELWGDEIPKRSDIKIITRRPTPGATQCLQYITGTGPKVQDVKSKGELQMILPDGTEVTDLSVPSLKKHMKGMGMDTWNIVIIRKSTGEEFEVQAVEDIFLEGFERFEELRMKVKMEKTATAEETAEFTSQWEEVRNAFLTQHDWELFEGIEEPEEEVDITSGIIFLTILIVAAIIGIVWYVKGKR